MAESGFKPARKTVKMISQVAIELREAKKPLAVERRPMTARVISARPTKGERKTLSRAVLQEKSGKNATLIFSMKPLMVRPGASKSSGTIAGLIKAATTRAESPSKMMKIVRIRGIVGRVLIVKRRCGWSKAKMTMKPAR